MFYWYFGVLCVGVVHGYPATWVQKIAESQKTYEGDNSVDKYDKDVFSDLDIYFSNNLTGESKAENYTKTIIPFTTEFNDKNGTKTDRNATVTPQSPIRASANIDPVGAEKNRNKANETRNPRQEVDSLEEKASQEEESSEEDEGGNMFTGLLSAFLSGLSRPDGSIDLEAIVGLLGSLSVQNPDGSYDFSGLQELLRSFFGGGANGGGSDIGGFLGGLLSALIKGVANPPGPKGAGILAGKLASGILPALSGPEPMGNSTKGPQLDSGSFLTGFLKTVLGSGGNGMGQGGRNSKYTLFKLLFSAITGVISAASSVSSNSDWN